MPQLGRRAPGDDASASSALPTTLVATRTSGSASATALVVDTGSTATSIPQPFDTSLGSNFTSSNCPNFFNSFLENSTFVDCVPLSLLLQTSSAFFDVTRSLVRTTQVLDASCSANFAQCSALMDNLAAQLIHDDHCGADYKASNPTVLQAYKGLVAYEPVYQAGCLRDDSGSYCFANAITNSSSPTDSYPYYLPVGVALPGGSRPTCNSCLQTTMDAFWTYTSNKTQPISQTYAQAAGVVNIQCGPNFVNATVSKSTTSGVAPNAAVPGLSSAALLLALSALLL
ncbi:c6 zinc finger domain containing protein [Diplodia corticola]|uniref:C6 zinc finger domain containing protein n=1 Tax=Diplodia corticola TaxID=236234 RepID=A0A1J9S5X6_9PEZI|nr:c6 zinc finger domain containing protein [Diplodia corticola]OJD35356.1 c6 zinc finger domain containing protein [Diplodia corticola]